MGDTPQSKQTDDEWLEGIINANHEKVHTLKLSQIERFIIAEALWPNTDFINPQCVENDSRLRNIHCGLYGRLRNLSK